jgi:glycosyltransferase involved in cell wall biosynthesis
MSVPVWLIATTFEPRGSSLYTLRLAAALPEFGFEPVIVCTSSARLSARSRQRLTLLDAPWLTRAFLRPFGIRRLLRKYNGPPPMLIHAQHRGVAGAAMVLANKLGCPYLVTIHDILAPIQTLEVMPDRLGGIVAVSPSVQRDLVVAAGVPADLVHVIPNGVVLPCNPVLPASSGDDRIPVVGTAGALEPIKGVTYFLMAAELILAAGHDVEFVIAGSGPDEEPLRQVARSLDIANRVTFVTHVQEYGPILDAFDVFVMPSLEQGLGTVMLEAMALGRPVVATRVGGIADFLVDGEHALLVPKANHVVLADKVQTLLDNPARARALAARGQAFVRDRFSVERMAQETANLYHAVLSHRKNA